MRETSSDFSAIIPSIRRAKDYRLYDNHGKRYLDLYQNGGHAILGHRGGKIGKVLKNVISTGLICDLPSVYHARLCKALSSLFPAFESFRVVSSFQRALGLISLYAGNKVDEMDLIDPALDRVEKDSRFILWRPFVTDAIKSKTEVLLPVLPFSAGGSPVAVCFRAELAHDFVCSDTIAPFLLAGAIRSIYDISYYSLPAWYSHNLLQGAGGGEQRGVYIRPLMNAESYAEVFVEFLKEGVLLSPRYPAPSILPAVASEGEVKKMVTLFRETY